jgi:uncharacterized membrane protein
MAVETPPLDEQGSSSSAAGAGRARVPWWPALNGTTLSLIGLGAATYHTNEHYTGSKSLSCPASGGLVNCLAVTTSIYSKIHGVPVAVLGLVFFVVMLVLQSPPAWSSPSWWLRGGRVLWSLVGVGTAVWLVYAELVKIRNICLWCTSVHIISLLIFLSTAFGTLATMPDIEEDEFEDEEFEG